MELNYQGTMPKWETTSIESCLGTHKGGWCVVEWDAYKETGKGDRLNAYRIGYEDKLDLIRI